MYAVQLQQEWKEIQNNNKNPTITCCHHSKQWHVKQKQQSMIATAMNRPQQVVAANTGTSCTGCTGLIRPFQW